MFLVVQSLTIYLPKQGTQVQSLVWEDSTCQVCTPHLLKPSCPRAPALQQKKPLRWEAWKPHLTKARVQRRRLSEAKKKKKNRGELQDSMCSSGQFSRSVVSNSLLPHELQHTRRPCLSPTPRVHPNSCALSRWCRPTISSSVVPFSSCLQSFPASESFPMSQLCASGGQSIGVSASASVLSMNTQDWSPLRWTGWISLQSKGLSRVFSNATGQKHQFFGAQLSL